MRPTASTRCPIASTWSFSADVLTADQIATQRAALDVPAGWPIVVYLGLLADHQGIPHLLQAARILKERGAQVGFLIGGFPVPRYRQMAADLGVSDRVIFTGQDSPRGYAGPPGAGRYRRSAQALRTEGAARSTSSTWRWNCPPWPLTRHRTRVPGRSRRVCRPVRRPGRTGRRYRWPSGRPATARRTGPQTCGRGPLVTSPGTAGRHLMAVYRSVLQPETQTLG